MHSSKIVVYLSKLKQSDMQTLNLKRIAETANLKASYIGSHLFPDNRDPAHAVRRVMRGKLLLNSEQIAKLSELLNVPIGLLFDSAAWHRSVEADRKNIIRFRAYDYYAELNTSTMVTRVSLNGVMFFEEVHIEKSIGMHDYLAQLTDIVIKYK